MFDIEEIELTNFKSYRGTHSFEFPKEPGLYYITGKNNYNPRLGANGIGKTSLIDAIQWCLYGKTTRGLKAGDIISWGEKGCTVHLTLNIQDNIYDLERSQNPNKILLNEKTVTQDEIDELFINQDCFNFSILTTHTNDSFFDLKPAKKLELFTQLMELEYWLERSADANNFAIETDKLLLKIEYEINNSKSKIESLNFDISSLTEKQKGFEKDKANRIKFINDEIDELNSSSEKFQSRLSKMNNNLKIIIDKHKTYSTRTKRYEDKTKLYNDKIKEVEIRHENIDEKINDLDEEITRIRKLKGKVCPECYQKVTVSQVKKNTKPFLLKISKLTDQLKVLEENYAGYESKHEENKSKFLQNFKMKSKLEEKRYEKESQITKYEYKLEACLKHIANLKKEIDKEKKVKNPFDSMIKQKKAQLNSEIKSSKKLRSKSTDLNKDYEAINFWINGFKRVRLFVVEQTLRNLEIEINNNFVSLGLVDWSVAFDIERETKTGGVSRGFNVFIKSPKYDKPVRWESWSGGETQRLNVAGDLGLSNLILERNGFESQIELHDEVSHQLTPEGIDDMLNTMYQRAVNNQKKIWLVDHQTMNFGNFSGILRVEMNEEGNSELTFN